MFNNLLSSRVAFASCCVLGTSLHVVVLMVDAMLIPLSFRKWQLLVAPLCFKPAIQLTGLFKGVKIWFRTVNGEFQALNHVRDTIMISINLLPYVGPSNPCYNAATNLPHLHF